MSAFVQPITIKRTPEGYTSSESSLTISHKVFVYSYNFCIGALKYDILDKYGESCYIANKDELILHPAFLMLMIEKQYVISDIVDAMHKQTGVKPWDKDGGVKTITITTKPPASTPQELPQPTEQPVEPEAGANVQTTIETAKPAKKTRKRPAKA